MRPRLDLSRPIVAITLALVLATLIHFPTFRCQESPLYESCGPARCGGEDFQYPFWGFGRPKYCGHPSFQLTCESNVPVLRLDSVGYRVLDTDSSTRRMTIARNDLWDTICPQDLRNTTYNSTLFNGNNFNHENVSLFYGCQDNIPLPATAVFQFRCDVNRTGQSTDSYFYRTSAFVPEIGSLFVQCNNYITVPVDRDNANVNSEDDLRKALQAGFKLEWFANNHACNNCTLANGRCGTNATGPVCYHRVGGSSKSSSLGIVLAIVGAAVVVVVVACGIFICRQQRKRRVAKERIPVTPNGPTTADDQVEIFIRNYGSLAPKIYKYSEVKKMTNSFLEKLGKGGYGSVYKGQLPDRRLVAVKLLSEAIGNGEDFINEVASIGRTSHVNIVTLLGFCFERKKRALLYEYMPNGSLDKFLRGDAFHLDWSTLFQIAKGIARGLEYLHKGCNTRIVHFDIKPHNILLDEEFVPKISDFGLAKLCKTKESIVSVMGLRGTAGYMAPEVFFKSLGGASHKSDVYSYGMMILEMTGARKRNNTCTASTSEAYFPDWVYKQVEVGGDLGEWGVSTKDEEELARKMIMVGLWCIQSNPSDRPSISKVVEMLEGGVKSLQVPPKRFESSPTRLFQGTGSIQSSSDERVTMMQGIVSLPNSHEAC